MAEVSLSKKIKHLYWRAGCGPDLSVDLSNSSVKKETEKIFTAAKQFSPIDLVEFDRPSRQQFKSMSEEEQKQMLKAGKNEKFELAYSCVLKLVEEKNFLREKMAFFWSSHFACKINEPNFAQAYINAIRKNALGSFADLLTSVSKSAAMLQYLNNNQNKKRSPNENFAREVMELFALGIGNYTEQDVKEAARAFTGWTFEKSGEFIMRTEVHDEGDKTIFGQSGNYNGDDVLRMLLEKKQCAVFIVSKIYRYFVNDIVDDTIVTKLAEEFYQNNYDIEKLMRTIFNADWFYDAKNVGVKIKSPIDLIAGMMKIFNVRFADTSRFLAFQRSLGQELFHPPNVAGWPVGKGWIDNSTLMLRLKMPEWIFEKKHFDFRVKSSGDVQQTKIRNYSDTKQDLITYDFSAIEKRFEKTDDANLAAAVSDFLLMTEKSNTAIKIISQNLSSTDKAKLVALKVMSLPEYQMC